MITDEQWEQAVASGRCPVCHYDVLSEHPHSDGCPTSVQFQRELQTEAWVRREAQA